mmetsp:Transcript_3668/g.13177  ORF Transcript_3668/g.13177 Transcript_3668/m.13177 type:complete len:324 (+) Transcript_3668:131-1102(+)
MAAASAGIDVEDVGEWVQRHRRACEQGSSHYIDPETGYLVFTEVGLRSRGRCCGSGCRHCPYSHQNVRDKASKIKKPAWLYRSNTTSSSPAQTTVAVLFWSGGKDSFLTLRRLWRDKQADASLELVLLSTFDVSSRVIAHQEVSIRMVVKQAQHLDISLLGVPLHKGKPYTDTIREALAVIESSGLRVGSLCFGDLHLQHIRTWREKEMAGIAPSVKLRFPVWQVPYDRLLDDLELSGVRCIISACEGPGLAYEADEPRNGDGNRVLPSAKDLQIELGTVFSRELSQTIMKAGWDGMGENGECHTLAEVWSVPRERALGIGNA